MGGTLLAHIKRSGSRFMAAMPAPKERSPRRVVVLCYHTVHPFRPFASATPRGFQAHLEWLREHCDLIPLESALAEAKRPRRGRPAVAITFDEGYADNYDHAFPALIRLRVPATFFVTTGLIDGDPLVLEWIRQLQGASSLEDVSGLSWTQIREMSEAGLGFGSHTCTHANLGASDPQRVVEELFASKKVIEDQLRQSVDQVAYPFGKPKHHFNRSTLTLAAQCGYRVGVAIHYRRVLPRDHPLGIPRFSITEDSIDMLRAKVFGKLDLIGVWQERAPTVVSRALSRDTTMFEGAPSLGGSPEGSRDI